jgi:hypothetical protein
MRRMSFAMTTEAVRARRKFITRRQGPMWRRLKPQERFVGVEKCQGLKKGQRQVVIAPELECVDVTIVRIGDMQDAECAAEGFPEMTAAEFVAMYCRANRVTPDDDCARIVFRYVGEGCRCDHIAPELRDLGQMCSPCVAVNLQ